VAAAASFGIEAVSVGTAGELSEAIGGALADSRATVIAAQVDGPPAAEWIDLLASG
jgi:thiamine pyrophosphate-dependent acetolactate synthase large subunit-like protein